MKVHDATHACARKPLLYLRDKIGILTYFLILVFLILNNLNTNLAYFLKLAFLILNNLMYLCARNDGVKMVSRSFRILFRESFQLRRWISARPFFTSSNDIPSFRLAWDLPSRQLPVGRYKYSKRIAYTHTHTQNMHTYTLIFCARHIATPDFFRTKHFFVFSNLRLDRYRFVWSIQNFEANGYTIAPTKKL